MPWSKYNTIPSLKNKSEKVKEVFAEAANATLTRGKSEQEAIVAGLGAVMAYEKKHNIKKSVVVDEVPSQVQTPVVKNLGINQAFFPGNSLPSEDRQLVSAKFDDFGRLILSFDTGEQIITNTVKTGDIHQEVGISVNPVFEYLQFHTVSDVELQPGMLAWNEQDGTLDLRLEYDTTLQLGMELYCPPVLNKSGADIPEGTLVVAIGGDSTTGRVTVQPALANQDIDPFKILGITTTTIPNNGLGIVTSFGMVRQLNTTGSQYGETWASGDKLFASANIPGRLTNVNPSPLARNIPVAFVGVVSPTNGNIFVNIAYIPTPDFGTFFSTLDQTHLTIDTPKAVQFTDTVNSDGVSLIDGTKINIEKSGTYDFQFSMQVRKNNSSTQYLYIWPRINGVDVPNSAGKISISGNTTELVPSWNGIRIMNAGDYLELMWAVNSTDIYLQAVPPTTFCPATPSARMTVAQVNLV